MDFKDYYATLGVAKTATDKEIKQAYRKLARKLHPDVNPGDKSAEARFKEINEAYEVLGDPETRRKYDELGANWRLYEQAGPGPPPTGFPDWATGGGGYRTVSPEEMEELFGEENPFSDFFKTFFGGAASGPRESRRTRGSRTRARGGADVEHPIQLSLEEALHGTMRRLSLKHAGHTRTVDVRIPAGVKDQARVRVTGEGEPGANGGKPGDLYLRINLLPHERFERRGNDLYTETTVPLTTAVLGGEASVVTLDGRTLPFKVPPTTQAGQVFRLKGQGMPITGTAGERGDLYVKINIQLPRSLTPEQRKHFEALAGLEARG
jgi:curved DNA-binding protein